MNPKPNAKFETIFKQGTYCGLAASLFVAQVKLSVLPSQARPPTPAQEGTRLWVTGGERAGGK